jgi:hypothetical protein
VNINNYIPVSRKIFEHPFWCEDRVYSRFEAWLDILQSARFEDAELLIGNRLITVKRGQLPVSLRYLAERWKWSKNKVDNFISLLIHARMATKETPKGTGQTILTVCNYDIYNVDFKKKGQQRDSRGTAKGQQRDKNNKENKENKDNKLSGESSDEDSLSGGPPPDVSEHPATGEFCESNAPSEERIDYRKLVDWFNSETNGIFSILEYPLGEARRKSIRARIRERGKEAFFRMVKTACRSDFLKGQNSRNWTATFDWMLKPSNFEKIISGNYDNDRNKKAASGNNGIDEDFMQGVAAGIARAKFNQENG